ncbi:MAG: translocation/assembly module TamB domain-containing protein [Candidatus Zixiibacteriota bacterium]|nr:MAG: translocation/assembly module TamB domain-containing protein [candidate division Zixibacteria bacterium]
MRLVHRIILSLVISALVFVVTFYLALFQFGLIEDLANRALRDIIGDKLPLVVYVESLEGDLFSRLILKNTNVIYSDGEEKYILASVPELTLEYSFKDLWYGNLIFSNIYIDSATFSLKQSADGDWLFPKPEHPSDIERSPLDFQINDLGLNNLTLALIRPKDTLVFSNIILKTRVQGQDGTYAVDIDGLRYTSSEKKFNLVTSGGKLTLTGRDLLFQDVFIITDSSQMALDGHLVLGPDLSGQILLENSRLNIAEVSALINAHVQGQLSVAGRLNLDSSRVSGMLTVAGDFMERYFDSLISGFHFYDNRLVFDTLYGVILNGCGINAQGNLDFTPDPDTYNLVGSLENFNLNHAVANTFESRLSGEIALSGRGLRGRDLLLDIRANLGESWFDEYHAHSIAGDISITTDSVIFGDGFQVAYHNNLFKASGRINYLEDLYIDGVARFNDLSVFNGQTFIERMGGRGEAAFTFTGKTANPDIMASFSSDSLWLYEILSTDANIDCRIDRFVYDREGEVIVILRDGLAYDVPYDTVRLAMDIDTQFADFRSAVLTNQFASLAGTGRLDYLSYPQRLLLDTAVIDLLGRPFVNDSLIVVDIDSSGYQFVGCRLLPPIGYLEGTGRINYDESLDFQIGMDRIDIAPWLQLLTDEFDIAGLISGNIVLNQTFSRPVIDFQGRVDSLSYRELFLGNLEADIHYANRKARIDSVYLRSRGGYYIARGMFPIDLSLAETENRFPEGEQNIDIVAHDTRFDFITLIIPQVENLQGDFNASFKLSGEPLSPTIFGRAQLRDGTLKPFDLVLPLDDLNIDLTMENKTITIDSAAAFCRNGRRTMGSVIARGQIVISTIEEFGYNVSITAKDFPVKYELGDISALVDADLVVLGATPPTIFGEVDIKSGLYRENFAEEDEGWVLLSALEGEESWNLNLNAEIVSNLWIKNDDVDAELAGTINLIREQSQYRYIGSMEILRGKGYLADRTFRIVPGGTITYNDIEYPDPELDIYATTKVRGVSNEVDQFGQPRSTSYELCVHITNTLDEPTIGACEGSPFSTEEIIPLIFTNYYADGAANTDATERFEDRLTAAASGYLSTQFTQIGSRSLGVETFEIDPVYGDKFDPLGTRLTVGFYTHPNLYVYGRSAISGVAGKEVGFEYRLKRFLLMEGRLDENNLYHLILNFYWDY